MMDELKWSPQGINLNSLLGEKVYFVKEKERKEYLLELGKVTKITDGDEFIFFTIEKKL